MAKLGTNTAIKLSELPTGESSFLIQINFYICVILSSTNSTALGQFYSLWKHKVRKEPRSAKCRDENTNESITFIIQIIHFFFYRLLYFPPMRIAEEKKNFNSRSENTFYTCYI